MIYAASLNSAITEEFKAAYPIVEVTKTISMLTKYVPEKDA